MMILHLAAFIPQIINQVPQSSTVVQCVQQASPEAGWKWWMAALATWLGPLLSGAVSIYVAWWIFTRQGKKEREQWVRDQKKMEWKELLNKVSEIEHAVPTAVKREEGDRAVEEKLRIAVRELLACRASCLFTDTFWGKREHESHFVKLVTTLNEGAHKMESFGTDLDFHENDIPSKLMFLNLKNETYRELRGTYLSLRDWLVESARKDLNIAETRMSKVGNRK